MKLTTLVTSFGKPLTEIVLRAPIANDLILCGIPTRVERIAGQPAYGVDTACVGRLAERLGGLAAETTDLLSAPDFAKLINEVLGCVGEASKNTPWPLRQPTGKDIRLCGIVEKSQPIDDGDGDENKSTAQVADPSVVAHYASVLGGVPMEKVRNLNCPDFLALMKAVSGFFSPTTEAPKASSRDAGNSPASTEELTPST